MLKGMLVKTSMSVFPALEGPKGSPLNHVNMRKEIMSTSVIVTNPYSLFVDLDRRQKSFQEL
jgi:hypothetical protein